MSGVTDLAFRLVSRRYGASLCFLEMLDAHSILYSHPHNHRLLTTIKRDVPLAAQLLGADPCVLLDAAQKLLGLVGLSFLDINSACPAKKVIKKGAGSALLKDTVRLGKIVKKLADNLPLSVTVKLRSGFYRRDVLECVRTAQICQANGAACVFIHGRTVSQGYSGDVDYVSIKAVKAALKIPVFGSGNIFSPLLAKKMLEETGCDGIMVARGALGNPWIFKNIADYLKNGRPSVEPSVSVKKKTLKTHLAYIEKYKDISPSGKIGIMGKVAMWYLKGLPHAAGIRKDISRAKSSAELLEIIAGVTEL